MARVWDSMTGFDPNVTLPELADLERSMGLVLSGVWTVQEAGTWLGLETEQTAEWQAEVFDYAPAGLPARMGWLNMLMLLLHHARNPSPGAPALTTEAQIRTAMGIPVP